MKGISHAVVGSLCTLAVVKYLVPAAGHFLDGGLATGASSGLSDAVHLAALAAVGAVAALAPDIDSDEAAIRKATATAPSRSGCIGKLFSGMMRMMSGGHRNLTHTLALWLLLTGAGWLLWPGNEFVVAASLGWLSHLLADALTVEGVPLLWPVVRRRICFLPDFIAIRTGGVAEYLVVIALGALALRLWL